MSASLVFSKTVVMRFATMLLVGAALVGGFFVPLSAQALTTLTVTAPNGGEYWRGTRSVTWSSTGGNPGDLVDIVYSTNNFSSQAVVATGVLNSTGTYSWNTTGFPESGSYLIRFVSNPGALVYDTSDAVFMIDNTAPISSQAPSLVSNVDGWYNLTTGVPTITLSCADGVGSGCNKTYYYWDSNPVAQYTAPLTPPEGVHTLHYYSDDNATDDSSVRNVETEKTATYKVDTNRPTLAITLSDNALKIGDTSTVTFTWSEAVSGFDNTDITTIENGLLSSVTTSDSIVYTATFTPNAGVEDASNKIVVNKAGVLDVASNAGVGTQDSPNYAIDTLAPTVGIGIDDVALNIGDTALVTATFSEVPVGFDAADVTVENGSIGAIAGGPLVYTATLTPTPNIEDSSNVLTIGTGWTDAAGNAPTASSLSPAYAVDTIAPTAAITYSDADAIVKQGDSLTITATFSEALAAAPVVKIAITGANTQAATNMSGGPTVFTYAHTVGAGNGAATVAMSTGTDIAGNAVVSAPTSGATFTVDNTPPTLAITLSDNALKIGDTSTVTFTWSEAVSGFDNTDITTIENGSLSPVTTSDNIVYTATFTPNTSVEDAFNKIVVNKAGVLDVASNAGVGTQDSPNYAIDTLAPTVVSIATKDANENGSVDTATIVFSEDMEDASFIASDFSIGGTAASSFASGTANDTTVDISHGGVSGTDVKEVLYAPGTVTDRAGNPLAAILSATIAETDQAKPVLMSARTISTTQATATFSEDLNGATVNGTGNEFAVAGTTVTGATESANAVVTLTYAPALGTGAEPLVTYTQVDTLQDLAAAPNTAVTPKSVTAVDGVAPTLSAVTIKSNNDADTLAPEWAKVGDTATLTFTASETITTPTVTVDGMSATTITNVGNDWTATYTFVGDEADGTVPFSIAFADDALPTPNTGTTVTATGDGSSVFFDEVVPTVNAGTDKEVNATVAQDATASDPAPASNIATYAWTKTSGPGTITFGTSAAEDTTISANQDGTYVLRLTVTDNAGNSAYDEMTLIWDTRAPFVVTYAPTTGAINVPVAAGTATVRFNEDIVLLDGTLVALVNNATSVSVLGTPAVSGGDGNSPTLNLPYSALANGTTYRANVYPEAVRDVAGNVFALSFANHFTTEADLTAPVVTSLSAGSITTTGATLSAVTDENASCRFATTDSAYGSMTAFTTTGTTAHSVSLTGLSPETTYNYYVRCADVSPAANAMTTSAHVSFTTLPDVDATAPGVPVITTAPATTDSATYTIAGTAANDGGVRTLRLYNGATEVATISLPAGQTAWAASVSLTQESANVFSATSADEAGNVSAASASVTITEATATGDTTAPATPVITTTSATVDADTQTIVGTAGADAPLDGTRTITVYRNGTVVGSLTLPSGETDWSFVAPLLQNTANSFTAYSTDVAGNTSGASSAVVITEQNADTAAPTVVSTVPTNGATGVAVGSSIHVLFNEALDGTTVSAATVQLLDASDATVAATVLLAEGDAEVVITPDVNLAYSSVYHVDVTTSVKDVAGNTFAALATVSTFTTEGVPADTTAPAITDIRATGITHNSVTITWTTDEASDSQVEYGTTSGYGSLTTLNASMVTAHSVTITGLAENTVFHFRVLSKDVAANAAASSDNLFQTSVNDAAAVLAVTGIDMIANANGSVGYATADNTFENGWRWTFHMTVPTAETQLAMKFSDFVSGANTIAAASNIRFYSVQSSDTNSTATAKTIAAANTYTANMTLASDLDASTAGRQIEVTVEMRVPTGSAGGSYSGSYGVKSEGSV